MKETNAYPGNFGGKVLSVGFARHVSTAGYGSSMPRGGYGHFMRTDGFAQYFTNESSQETEEPTRRKPLSRAKRYNATKQKAETHPWPSMVVSNLIDKSEAGSDWRTFDRVLEMRARRIGRSVGLKNFQCVIIPAKELHNAMDEKYVSVARDPNPKRRLRLVQDTLNDINGIIEDLAAEEQHQAWADASDEPPRLWTSGYVRLVQQEGCGPHGIGMTLHDEEVFEQRKSKLVSRVCAELDFNPVHFSPIEQPSVLMVDTSPLSPDGLHFAIPPAPYDIPFRAVRAYGPDHQAAKLSVMV